MLKAAWLTAALLLSCCSAPPEGAEDIPRTVVSPGTTPCNRTVGTSKYWDAEFNAVLTACLNNHGGDECWAYAEKKTREHRNGCN